MTFPDAVRMAGVGVRFGKIWALRDATLDIPAGSVVAVVGTNGAGKTSLIRTLVGLQAPTEGSVEIFGRPFDRDDPADLARIGYVGQRKPLYGYLRVHEMLRYGQVSNPAWNAAFADRRIRDLDIDARKRIDQLSGGQRTQVALTMALAKEPDLLVLDEPMSDLDPLAREEVRRTLMAAVEERGVTVMLSSHVLGELEEVCNRIVALTAGRVVLAGETDSLAEDHLVLTGPADGLDQLARQGRIVDHRREGATARVLVRLSVDARFLDPRWLHHPARMDTVVIGYLRAQGLDPGPGPALRVAQ